MRTTTRVGRPAKRPTTINTNVREGRFIKRMRNFHGYTAEQVASYVGVNRTTLQNYESGEKRIPDCRVEALAEVLQVDAWEIRVMQEALVMA